MLVNPTGTLRARRPARRLRPHRPQDHRRHLRRHGPPRRRRVLGQGPVQGRPLGRLRRPLGGQERRRRRRRHAAARSRWPTPSASPSRVDPGRDVRHRAGRPRARSSDAVREVFDLRPAAIIRDLDLRRPIYQKTAAYGHFGRADQEFTWEHTTRLDDLQQRARRCRSHRSGDPGRSGPPRRAAIDKTFDYLVPDALGAQVRVGAPGARAAARPPGRRAGSSTSTSSPPAGRASSPSCSACAARSARRAGRLAGWAAWRWAGRPSPFLGTASAPRASSRLPPALGAPSQRGGAGCRRLPRRRVRRPGAVVRLPPAARSSAVVLAAARARARARRGSVGRQARGARRSACGARASASRSCPATGPQAAAGADVVIGARAAAWAPVRDLGRRRGARRARRGLRRSGSPTWHARDVAIERAGGRACPVVLVVAVPDARGAAVGAPLVTPSRNARARGWPAVEVVDMRRRRGAHRTGLYSDALVRRARVAGACGVRAQPHAAGPACWRALRAASWRVRAVRCRRRPARATPWCADAARRRAQRCAWTAVPPGSRTCALA